MFYAKIVVVCTFLLLMILTACSGSTQQGYVIANSKAYEASLFRQNCAVCHGPEGNGKTLDDGRIVPSLREANFKFNTEDEIYDQIANGGNGMTPFRGQLTERELRMMSVFVHDQLRKR